MKKSNIDIVLIEDLFKRIILFDNYVELLEDKYYLLKEVASRLVN